MSVCEFVSQVKQLDGRFVSVRGTVQTFSPKYDEFYLDAMIVDNCPGHATKKVRVRIEYPDVHFLNQPPPGYEINRASFLRARRIVKQAQKQGKSVNKILATIQGIAYAPGPEPKQVDAHRRLEHGTYDAMIVIQAIQNVTILNE